MPAQVRDEGTTTALWITAIGVPVLLFLALYGRSLSYEFVWTDQTEIQGALVIRPPGEWIAAFAEPMYPPLDSISPGSVQPYYRPLKVFVASAVDHYIGREPAAFRSVNLAVGAATVALFAVLSGVLFRDLRAAGLAAAVLAAHPVGIQSYVWISGIDHALALLFVVATLLASVLAARGSQLRGRVAGGAVALLLFALGLASKESALVTPALSVACLFVDRARVGAPAARGWATASWVVGSQLALGALYWLVLRPAVLGGFDAGTPPIGGRYALHLLTILSTWPDRIAWIFLPLESTTSDVVKVVRVVLEPSNVVAVVLALSAPYVFFRLLRAGRADAALGWIWIWIAFAPTSGVIPLSHIRAERHVALSSFGAAWVLAAAVAGLARFVAARVPRPAAQDAVWVLVAVALVGGLAWQTHARIGDWRSDLTLFASDVERDPLYREGRYLLAVALAQDARFEEAREQLLELTAVNDRFQGYTSFLRQDGAVRLMCEVNLELGRQDHTLEILGRHLRPDSPALPANPAFFACGAKSLERAGRIEEARAIRRALQARGAR